MLYGILRGYRILYTPEDSIINSEEFTQIPPEKTSYVVMNLELGTNYSVQVAAVTIDVGPYSSPIYITTDPYDQNGNVYHIIISLLLHVQLYEVCTHRTQGLTYKTNW